MLLGPRAESAAALLALAMLRPSLAEPRPSREATPLPIAIAVARRAGQPVADARWIGAQVTVADRVFQRCAVRFQRLPDRQLPERYLALERRADRDALSTQVLEGAINVFVVASLRDVDDPALYRLGVHWRPRRFPGKRFIIITPDALPTTLAHELGHFFGNGHTRLAGNLMSYRRKGEEATLTADQIRRIRREVRLLRRRLVPVGEPHPEGDRDVSHPGNSSR
jgi:hypothetical protein